MVGSEDFEIRAFAADEILSEISETEAVTGLAPLAGQRAHARGPEEVHDGVQHAQMNVLPLARPGPREQRRRYGLRHGEPGQLVGHDGAHQARAALVRPGLDCGQAAKRLDQGVEDGFVGVRPRLAEPADGRIDHIRTDRLGGLIADAHPVGDAGAKILHNHVGSGDDLHQRVGSARLLQVQNNRPFVTVVVEETG